MPFLQLKGIGKIYVSNNNVTVGIRDVNLSFELGEFVAITGKSGAGKSTLLNVISGIDSYEEGELLIEGNQTSHYLQNEWEEYRKKYISFIFQDYNIIDSYTVLENVELSLMHIQNPIERRKQAVEYITRVGLKHRMKYKGSKLSGGEKQRTVIARALAKNSPIIVADEPTGNLDSQTSKEIIELLHEIAKNRLLIVVTHNYDDFKDYATRHIRVYDGGIESDEQVRTPEEITEVIKPIEDNDTRMETFKKGIRLGKTIFFAKPRLAIFMILLMLIGTIGMFYSASTFGSGFDLFKKEKMFTEMNGRVVIIKNNGDVISNDELNNLKNKYNATDALHYDFLVDKGTNISFYINAFEEWEPFTIAFDKNFGSNIYGSYPKNDDEVFLYLPISDKVLAEPNDLIGSRIGLDGINSDIYKVTGVKYFYDNNKSAEAVFTRNGFETATALYYVCKNSSISISGSTSTSTDHIMYSLQIAPTFDIEKGKVYVYDKLYNQFLKKYNGENIETVISFLADFSSYYSGRSIFSYDEEFKQYTFESRFETKDIIASTDTSSLDNNSYLVISVYDIVDIASKTLELNYVQASLFFKNNSEASKAIEGLKDDGYIAIRSDQTYKSADIDSVLTAIGQIFSLVGFVLIIIFIAFFINLVTSKSLEAFRNELGIMRSMGINVKIIKIGNRYRLVLSVIPAFIIVIIILIIFYLVPKLNPVFRYLYWYHYLLIVIGMFILIMRVGRKQDKKLFNQSVKNAIRNGEDQ